MAKAIPFVPVLDGAIDVHKVLQMRRTAWKVPEYAELLAAAPRTIYDAIACGGLRAFRVGTAVRISPTDALAWVEAGTTGQARKAA